MNDERRTNHRPSVFPFSVHRSSFIVSRARAFTLLETLLVLALLVVLGGLIWPALEKPLAAERLRKSADQLCADLNKARVAAINGGQTHALQLEQGSGRYAVIPFDDGAGSDPFSLPAEANAAGPAPVIAEQLPEGTSIAAIVTQDDITPPPMMGVAATTPAATSSLTGTATQNSTGAVASSGLIYFHPDGTTTSAEITLTGEYGNQLRVFLRGLTGQAAVGDFEQGVVTP